MADLDSARLDPTVLGQGGEVAGIVLVVGGRVAAGPAIDDRREVALEIDVAIEDVEIPDPATNQILVRSTRSLISAGTETAPTSSSAVVTVSSSER